MKIEIKNFGPIDYLVFDLEKDLHLIYGHNAIGKSYATYCIYCLLKNVKENTIYNVNSNAINLDKEPYLQFKNFNVNDFLTENDIATTELFLKIVTIHLKEVLLQGIENSLKNTFISIDNLKNRHSNKNFEIVCHVLENETLHIFCNEDNKLDLKYIPFYKKIELKISKNNTDQIDLLIDNELLSSENLKNITNKFIITAVTASDSILTSIFYDIQDIYFLPASRSGLYTAMNSYAPILAELSQNRFFLQNKTIDLPSLSEPVADYFIDLSTLNNKNLNNQYNEIVKQLENTILKGRVSYNEKSKRIVFNPNGIDLELNLSEASSMVSELSPLVLYFKHILNHKYSTSKTRDFINFESKVENNTKSNHLKFDILFIEEPEAHLHPEIQVILIKIFAQLSALNIKIFITSHSNYMFNQLNNLLITKEINPEKVEVYHLIKLENGTIANPEMIITDDGVNDDNFQAVSQKLYEERINYLEKNVD